MLVVVVVDVEIDCWVVGGWLIVVVQCGGWVFEGRILVVGWFGYLLLVR